MSTEIRIDIARTTGETVISTPFLIFQTPGTLTIPKLRPAPEVSLETLQSVATTHTRHNKQNTWRTNVKIHSTQIIVHDAGRENTYSARRTSTASGLGVYLILLPIPEVINTLQSLTLNAIGYPSRNDYHVVPYETRSKLKGSRVGVTREKPQIGRAHV